MDKFDIIVARGMYYSGPTITDPKTSNEFKNQNYVFLTKSVFVDPFHLVK